MNNWIIKDMIKSGQITFEMGDEVVLFWKKGNGYPKSLKKGEVYIVHKIENEHIYVLDKNSIQEWLNGNVQYTRVHKSYLIPVQVMREIKLNSLLS